MPRSTGGPKSKIDRNTLKRNCEIEPWGENILSTINTRVPNGRKDINVFTVFISAIGRTGEPLTLVGQRVRSTRVLERDLARGRRFASSEAAGKGPKQTDVAKTDVSYSTSKESPREVLDRTDEESLERRLQALWYLPTVAKAERLWKLLDNINLWCAAYKKLSSKTGSMTHGGERGTIDGTSLKTLRNLRDAVVSGKYQYGLTRRVYIPKPKGGELGIPEFRDRLVQEVTRVILESIFEPKFEATSHGFRPGRSQHTCLRQVRRDFVGVKWYIEGDISKCYDTMDHQIIMTLLRRRIKDQNFLQFVERGLNTKVLLPNKHWSDLGTPLGGVCSPLISNIVLHELDKFMVRISKIINRRRERKQNPAYTKLYNLMRTAQGESIKIKKLRTQARQVGYGRSSDETFLRCSYVRFADDFVIGISGPKALAVRVRELVARFLARKLRLKLSEDKTAITRAKGNKVPFLGYLISHGNSKAYTYRRRYGGKYRTVKAVRGGRIRLQVDQERLLANLRRKGFCNGAAAPVPNFLYLQYPQSHTVNQVASVVRGIANYYILADDFRQKVNRVSYIVRYSVAMMFAAKYKLRTIAKVFAVAGKDLGRPIRAKDAVGMRDDRIMEDANRPGAGPVKVQMRGIPYSKYNHIPMPDLSPLARKSVPLPTVHLKRGGTR